MAFIETRFPDDISYGASGGPGFNTDVVEVNSGSEQRNSIWQDARGSWNVSHGVRTDAQLATLITFFRVMGGRAKGFRFKDWQDYQATSGQGLFVALSGTTFQMIKRYTVASNNHDRDITKPVSGTVSVTGGTGVSVDYTTGVVTVSSGTPTAWTGQFDVPARFDTDKMSTNILAYGLHGWGNIPVIEIRPE